MLSSSCLVLVTGANGHVAQHIISQLLTFNPGPRVRGTVRSARQADVFKAAFPKEYESKRLEIALVPDIIVDGAFNSALKDVTHIAHVASPFIIDPSNVERNILQPAIAGTASILKSAATQPSVQRVVVTSSFGSIFDISKGWGVGYTYSEKDWNPLTREDAINDSLVIPNAEAAHLPYKTYIASKVLAEHVAWDFLATTTPPPTFTLSTILPTYIFGPSILPLSNGADSLSFSNAMIWKTASADGEKYMNVDWPFGVDVRDVARAHVLALDKDEAAGQRFIASSEELLYSDMADIVRKHYPTLSPASGPSQKFPHYVIDNTKLSRVLGMGPYIPLEQSVRDVLDQVVEHIGS